MGGLLHAVVGGTPRRALSVIRPFWMRESMTRKNQGYGFIAPLSCGLDMSPRRGQKEGMQALSVFRMPWECR